MLYVRCTPQVLGVISNQRTPKTREWIRSTYMSEAASLEGVLLRFVIGRHGLNQDDKKRLRAERRKHGDLELIAASDFAQAPNPKTSAPTMTIPTMALHLPWLST